MAGRTLNHFAMFSFKDAYWYLSSDERRKMGETLLGGLCDAAQQVDVYQVYPARSDADILVWSVLPAEPEDGAARFFEGYVRATAPLRKFIQPMLTLWGFTRPSPYAPGRRPSGEKHPTNEGHKTYLIVYPFVKTMDWYLMSRDARQGMMNEHIHIGHQHPEVAQLLLYSFGLQNQEFVVCYETEDLIEFSDLVMELRSSEARRFTAGDTPIFTAVYRPAEETLALWR